jgi:serine/threonine-protein kinase
MAVPVETLFLQQAVHRGLLSLQRGRRVVDQGRRLAAAGRPVDVLALACHQLPPERAQPLRELFADLLTGRPTAAPPPPAPSPQPEPVEPEAGEDSLERTAAMSPPPELLQRPGSQPAAMPSRIGNYDVLEHLGSGASAAVYRAKHGFVGNELAIKVMHEGAEEHQVERFFHEARAATQLRHPALVSVLDLGLHEGRPYLVLELVDGEPLSKTLARAGALPSRLAAAYAWQLARGLIEAHQILLHRDIKPENILVAGHQVRLSDFGLVRQVHTTERLTRMGDLLGSPAYMSPEQARGEVDLDARVDVYGLGATLYEMLTGRPPFGGETLAAVLLAVIEDLPPPPRSLAPDVDLRLQRICLRCLEKDPDDRYPSAGALAEALSAYLAS